MSETRSDNTVERFRFINFFVIAVCCVTVIFDGYDLNVYGAVLPALLEDQGLDLTPAQAGAVGSAVFMGMVVGALVVGTITDIIGRKRALVLCIVWYSAAMILCAFAPTPALLGLFRFLAGLGLGGVLPTATALTVEYAPRRWGTLVYAIMFAGFPLGAVLGATLAIPVLPAFGWRAMFLIGAAPLLLVVPLVLKFMPESVSFLLARGRRDEAEALAQRYGLSLQQDEPTEENTEEEQADIWQGLRTLFSGGYLAGTLLFWAASFLAFLMLYGLNTWLPTIMREAGYPLGPALSFLIVLNLGGAIGALFTAAATDRFGSKRVCMISFLIALAAIGVLSIQGMPQAALYAVLPLAGVGTHGTQLLINAYVSRYYPASSRATALGWSLGIGRIGAICGPLLGGFLVGAGVAVPWGFYAFALPGLVGAFVAFLVPRSPTEIPARGSRRAQEVGT